MDKPILCSECSSDNISMVNVDINDVESFEVTYHCEKCNHTFTKIEG